MDKENKLIDFDRLDCGSEFTKAVPQIIMASDANPNGVFLHIEQRAYIAKELEEQGYRKTEEVTLKLDLGDRTPEEIKQIAERFSKAMSTMPAVVSLSESEIRKQAVMEFAEELKKKYQPTTSYAYTVLSKFIDELLKEQYGK